MLLLLFAQALGVTATLAATEAADTLSATGGVLSPITATLAATDADDTLSARGGRPGWIPVDVTVETWTAVPVAEWAA